MMVSEHDRVRGKIPELFATLMAPHLESYDEVLSPGLTVLRWTSLKLGSYIDTVHAAQKELELLIDRVNGIHEHRIQVVFKDMLNVPLCEIPVAETTTVDNFISSTASLCSEASSVLDNRSQIVEKAVEEIITLLLGPDQPLEEAENEATPGAIAARRRSEQRAKLQQEAHLLEKMYEQWNVENMIQLMRSTLESIRKRVTVTTHTLYREHSDGHKGENPLFKSDVVLALPSLIMRPTLDEIQQGLNLAVLKVTSVSKKVYRWGQERSKGKDPSTESRVGGLISRSDMRSRSRLHFEQSPPELQHYHRVVSDNKEVAKLVSMLSAAINSTKTLVSQGVAHFNRYQELWAVEKEEHLKEYLEGDPGVNEFRSEMWQYAQLEEKILTEPDSITAGAISLSSEGLKITLCAEAKGWRVAYGRTMSHKYQTVMEEVFGSIDDWSKLLSRPLNDLDDIRSVMATLKEIRENEIRIDMSLEPIEVRQSTCMHVQKSLITNFMCSKL